MIIAEAGTSLYPASYGYGLTIFTQVVIPRRLSRMLVTPTRLVPSSRTCWSVTSKRRTYVATVQASVSVLTS